MERDIPRISRREFLRILLFSFLPSCQLSPQPTPPSESPPEKKAIPSSKECLYLPKGEAVSFGKLTILNQSESFNLCVVPSWLPQKKAVEAGLTTAPYPLVLFLIDKQDADPTTVQEEVAVTLVNPKAKERFSAIALGKILKEAQKRQEKPIEEEKFCSLLSVIISQVALVEIYSLAHSYQVSLEDKTAIEALNKKANELGRQYRNEMVSGKAKPFINVISVKD